MNTSSSNHQQDDRPAIIQFSDSQNTNILQNRSHKDERQLRRRESTASHAIIAYRTLSITISESQAKGINKSKKPKLEKSDIAEGNKKQNKNDYTYLHY